MSYQIQVRRDAAADWTSENPTLAEGEFGYETDSGKLKVGDGVTGWTSLGYFGGVDSTAIHDDTAGEIHAISVKNTPVGADELVIEDSAASWAKKRIAISTLPGIAGIDTDAIHDNVSAEINAIASKSTPVAADEFVIEDSAASYAKKKTTLSEIEAVLDHDSLSGFVANEHIDWTGASAGTIHTDNYVEGGPGTDTTAIHDDTTGEINAISAKTQLDKDDLLLIEDSDASYAKKKITVLTMSDVYNVKHYGAAGNGVDDDTSEIQAALDAASADGGGIVFVPVGTYIIDYVDVPSGVTLCGVGPESLLKKTNLANAFAVRMWGSASGSALTLASNATSPTKTVVLNDASSLSANDWIIIYDTTDQEDSVNLNRELVQIASIATNTLTLKNTLINSYTTAASASVEKVTSLIEGAVVRDLAIEVVDTSETTTTSAVRLGYTYNCTVANVTATGYVWGGIYATTAYGCKFIGNTCGMPNGEYTSALDRGIFLSLSHHCVIANNCLRSNRHGIILDYGSSCNTVTGNSIFSVLPPTPYSTYITDGINFHAKRSRWNTVSGNTIHGGIYGIVFSDDYYNIISNNTIRNPYYYGIYGVDGGNADVHVTISGNYIEGGDSYYGIYLVKLHHVEISGNRIKNGVNAVRAVNCDDIHIVNNHCTTGTTAYAIHVTNSLRPRIEGNRIYGNPVRAIYVGSDSGEGTEVAPVTDGIILDNYSNQSSSHGIALVDAQDFEVRGNRLESVGGYAVWSGTVSSTCSGWLVAENWAPGATSGFINTIPSGSILRNNPGIDDGAIVMTCYNNTGGSLSRGDLCYIDGDQSGTPRLALTDADAAATATGALVMVNETIGVAASGLCVVFGWVTGLTSLTAGAKQYVSTTAGETTETAPSASSDIVRVVGYAMSTTEMFFNPDGTWVEIA